MGLPISDHRTFQEREWKVERFAWVLLVAMLLAAAGGLLGRGPLSSSTATGADRLVTVDYQRFGHLEADAQLSVSISSVAVGGKSVEVELDGDWVRAIDISAITPEPKEQTATAYGMRLTVAATPGADLEIQITYRAREIGGIHAGVRFGGDTIPFDQFVYP